MIESVIQTKVLPSKVWQSWHKAHKMEKGFHSGQKGALTTKEGSVFSYRILDVHENESFKILWKSLFVHLIFTHTVRPQGKGSEISYQVEIRGLMAPLARIFLRKKIQSNLQLILRSLVRELESNG